MKGIFAGIAIAATITACTSNTASEAEIQQARQFTIDSMKAVAAEREAEARIEESRATNNRSAVTSRRSNGNNTVVYRNNTQPASTTNSRDAHDRPGWSNKAKGAVVGGVVGAATGAAVSDKKAKGAVIGGVVGAAGGYGVGAIIDNQKKRNQ